MIDEAGALRWTHVQLDETNLFRTPILLSAAEELMLIDGGFTLSSGRLLVEDQGLREAFVDDIRHL